MFQAKSPGAGLYQISLAGVVCLSLATSLWAQDSKSQRIPYQVKPIQNPASSQDSLPVLPVAPKSSGSIVTSPAISSHDGSTPITDDEPDFAPMEEINQTNADGEIVSTEITRKGNPYVLDFVGGRYVPERGIDPQLLQLRQARANGFTYGYVMLRGRMADARKVATLKQLGVEILGVHTYQSYIAKIPLAQLPQIGALPFVQWVGHARLDQKIEPRLRKEMQGKSAQQRFQVDISVFASDIGEATVRETIGAERVIGKVVSGTLERVIPNGRMQRGLEALGFEFGHYTEIGNVHIFEGSATAEQISKIRELDFVSFIEAKQMHESFHDQTVSMTGQDRVRGNYTGSTITLGVIDTGMSNNAGGGVYKTHRDLAKAAVGWSTVTGLSAWQDGHGHGTHVAGTMIGTGTQDKRYMGNAPGVGASSTTRFFVGKYLNNSGKGQGSVSSIYSNMKSSFTSGGKTSPRPRAINNSWGSSPLTTQWTGTESGARTVDNYVYTYGQTYVFAAGNKGVGVGSPGSAKNALTVGSVDDYWSGSIKPGDKSSFSRAGVKDGRRKPEIMAPGSVITSTLTKSTTGYTKKSGTSMAAPHVAGSIASLVQRWGANFNYQPEVIKSMIAASADWQGHPGGTSGWFGYGGAFGLLNNYRMMNQDSRYALHYGRPTSPLTVSGQYKYYDFTVPSSIKHAKLVTTFIEQAAGSGATKARVCDLRVYVDIFPFSAGGKSGEYVISSSSILSLSKTGLSFTNAIRGKKVRLKIYAQSIPSGFRPQVSWTMFYYTRPIIAPNAVLNAYAQTPKVKPGAQFYWFATLTAGSGSPDFSNARIYPSFSSLFPIQYMYRRTLDKTSILQQYFPTSSYPSSPYPSLSRTTSGGMTVGAGNFRWLAWRLKAPTSSGTYTLRNYAVLDRLSVSSLTDTGSICVDGLAPNTVSGLGSTTHPQGVWRSSKAFLARWTKPTDLGCAGISGLAYSLTTSPTSVPSTQNITGAATGKSLTIGNTNGVYFHIRARDAVGNLSKITRHYGPIRVDTTKPTVTSVRINNNSTWTRSLNVGVRVTASDSYSGPRWMRFSSNNSSWTSWRSYTTATQVYSLNLYGGSTSQGLKRVYVQIRDYAGNTSSSASDSILFDSIPPLLSSVSVNNGATYTKSSIVGVRAAGLGASHMQYSFNGTSWSGLFSYTSGTRSMSVGSYGGSTSQGTKRAYVRLRDLAGNTSVVKSDSIIYDSVAPVITLVRINNGAPYTNSQTVSVQVLGSGSPALVQYSFNNSTWSPWMSYTTGNRSLNLGSYGGNTLQGLKTVYARLRDGATNVSTTRSDSIRYDKTAPVVTLVRINGGATYTSSTTVGVQVLGSGNPSQVQYSFNGTTWSSWMSYTTGNRSLSVASYGGNTNTGTKTVYARLRDAALNVSTTKTDTIIYLKIPTISTSSGTTWSVIHDNKITLNGSGFADVNRAYVGSNLITSKSPEDWHKGYMRILSDSKMEVYPPQNLKPGNYVCYVRNSGFKSANFGGKVVLNTTSKTGVPTILKSGKVFHVYTARGPRPSTTLSILTFSASSKPLVIPGLISLGHGGNTTTFIDPSFTIITPGQLHNASTRTAHWAFPTPAGKIAGLLYWQSVMFDAANPTATPIPTSTTDVVKFYK